MKAMKVFCEDCDTITYLIIDSYHTSYELVMCSNCGGAICCNENNVVNIEETIDISHLVTW